MTESKANLIKTLCAICDTDRFDKVVYPANFDYASLSSDLFSARRLPDRCHYRIVRCRNCGLVRSNPIVEEKALEALYQGSHFHYEREAAFAAESYLRYLKRVLKHFHGKIKLLEVGCGNGFFLKKANALGLEAYGIEPSHEAVEKAGELRANIHTGMFRGGIYPNHSFDIICAFQVFDHISRPNEFLCQCQAYLKRGGLTLFINHNIGFWLAKWLGENCPMIDVAHTYLYDTSTLKKIFQKNGFEVLEIFGVTNNYPLSYWLKLMPLRKKAKDILLSYVQNSKLGRLPLKMRLGNMGIIARSHHAPS